MILEDQEIAGRWRALTRTYARRTLQNGLDISSSLRSNILGIIRDVLLVAGCTAYPLIIQEELGSKLSERMSALINLTIRLRQALGEEITSGDLHVTWIPSDVEFDPATMEDIGGQGLARIRQDRKKERVLCTTELGLQRLVRAGPRGYERSWHKTDLLKTKVALLSITEGMASYGFGRV